MRKRREKERESGRKREKAGERQRGKREEGEKEKKREEEGERKGGSIKPTIMPRWVKKEHLNTIT